MIKLFRPIYRLFRRLKRMLSQNEFDESIYMSKDQFEKMNWIYGDSKRFTFAENLFKDWEVWLIYNTKDHKVGLKELGYYDSKENIFYYNSILTKYFDKEFFI